MKIRTDYVTNSSSSSFVIAYRNLPEFDADTLTKYPFLSNYGNLIEKILLTEGYNDTTAGRVFNTKEEWDSHFIYQYGWKDINTIEKILAEDDDLKPQYDEAIKYLENGFNILEKSIDYNDDTLVKILHEMIQYNDNFVILQED